VNIPRENNNQVSSMINFVRNIGGSVGIALVGAFITRDTQSRQSYLSSNLRTTNPHFQQMVAGISGDLQKHGVRAAEALSQAYARVWLLVERQATALAYKDVVSLLAILVICLVPLTFIMKRPPAGGGTPPPAH
jgi:DHA2 family multidrug resistance protein